MGNVPIAASRVTVNPKLLRSNLTFKKKKALRTEAVKAYIRSKPAGTVIRSKEIARIANLHTDTNAYMFMKRLVEKGILIKTDVGPRSFSYAVAEDAKTVSKPVEQPQSKVVPAESTPEDVEAEDKPYEARGKTKLYTVNTLEKEAAQFQWSTIKRGYTATLYGFIDWLRSQEDAE